MNKKALPFDLALHEIGFLILLVTAFFFPQPERGSRMEPFLFYSASLVAAVVVLVLRCREEWLRLPNKWFFSILTVVWVVLFSVLGCGVFNYLDPASVMGWMYNIYVAPQGDEGQGLIMPFVVLVLYWWKRKELVAKPLGLWWPAIGLIFFALLLHVVGFKAQQPRLSVIAFFLGLYGLTGLAWGWNWLKASFFPFFLLVFCIPIAELAAPLTMPLRLLVSSIVEQIAHLGLAPDLIREGTQLFDSQHTFAYEVAAACSGIHSLVALLALTTVYGFLNFNTTWQRMIMMGIALPLAILGNVVRLCFTICVAESFGQSAGKAVETNFGFLTFAVAVAGSFMVARWLEKYTVVARPTDQLERPSGSSFSDKPVMP